MYEQYFGLKEKPFNVTSDPAFLFFSRKHKEAFSHLIYGIKERKGFLEITGEIGTGKTTICKALLNQLDKSTKTALILNPDLNKYQLLRSILQDFGIDYNKNRGKSLQDKLNQFLIEQLTGGNNVVLIVDEAQNLKNSLLETIRLLSNLETEKDKLLQIVLVGQPELRERLKAPELRQLRQRIGVRYHISPLEKDEVQAYISHRLSVAGSSDCISFDDQALNEIFKYSQGIPRLINLICDKALLAAFVSETRTITQELISRCINDIEGNQLEVTQEVNQ
ncbi:MAG: AAA family ATPase [Candidatus Omnitrophica bacterium]|nr:AAA family ATPase [Candidatus Omnitrophota bacterium]